MMELETVMARTLNVWSAVQITASSAGVPFIVNLARTMPASAPKLEEEKRDERRT